MNTIGDESLFDLEKIYNFLLYKDIAKLKKRKNNYQTKVDAFNEEKIKDPNFQPFLTKGLMGKDCKTCEVSQLASEISWRETTMPDGPRFKERLDTYIKNLPKGPTEKQVYRQKVLEAEKYLWEIVQ